MIFSSTIASMTFPVKVIRQRKHVNIPNYIHAHLRDSISYYYYCCPNWKGINEYLKDQLGLLAHQNQYHANTLKARSPEIKAHNSG